MSVETYAALLVDAVKQHGFDGMAPARRRILADTLRYVADKADPPAQQPQPKSGVLADLANGARTE